MEYDRPRVMTSGGTIAVTRFMGICRKAAVAIVHSKAVPTVAAATSIARKLRKAISSRSRITPKTAGMVNLMVLISALVVAVPPIGVPVTQTGDSPVWVT